MQIPNLHILDLHGLTWAEAEASFAELYNQTLRRYGENTVGLDVVHGYGSTGTGGVLRTRLRVLLTKNKSCLDFRTGEQWDNNPGHTIVVPLKPFPSLPEQLFQDICDFCERPKSHSKIIGKFRKHGETTILSAIKTLEKQKRLRRSDQGAHKLYQAI